MSGEGPPRPGDLTTPAGFTLGLVGACWHQEIADRLLHQALAMANECHITAIRVERVPGVMELPVVAQAMALSCDAVVALGVVLRGETPHFDYVCQAATSGLVRVALDARTPVANGVLMCETTEQARNRAGFTPQSQNKGREAVAAAVAAALSMSRVAQARQSDPLSSVPRTDAEHPSEEVP
ncbi:6,7-dimethyl-8-ribityllumazine synthase [Streptomyces sp. 1222.5]|uniref:6,7-dimethyl-8-ribityllumazine synthase n=1 Tax=Streptomyces sp. 1222.5 TaxID=1881026 RepID=UPI003EBEFFF8